MHTRLLHSNSIYTDTHTMYTYKSACMQKCVQMACASPGPQNTVASGAKDEAAAR